MVSYINDNIYKTIYIRRSHRHENGIWFPCLGADTSALAGPWQGGCLGLSWSNWPQRFIQTCPLCPQPCLDCTAKSALKAMTRGNRRWLILQGDKLTQTREMGHGRDWSELESNASLERHSNLTCSEVLWTANRTQLWSRGALVSFFVTWAVASITVFGVGATQTTQGNMFTANPFLVRQDWEGE